jgi:hypothetical protein
MKKKFYLSKTFWFGAITFIGSMVPAVQTFATEHVSEIGMVWSSLAIVLRFVSKDKIVLND